MNKIKYLILTLGIITGFCAVALPVTVSAIDVFPVCRGGSNDTAVCKGTGDKVDSFINTAINVTLYILGAISVVMIIIAGVMYTTSAGDAAAVAKAKSTLMYSIVGLVVAILAYAIVNFVLKAFKIV